MPKPIDFFGIITKNGNIVTGATLCIKNVVKDFIFPFTDDVLHDEKIAVTLALRKSLFYSTENLISYRIHDKQQVGMKNMDKLVSKNRLKRIVLGLDQPSSFKEYRLLAKKKYMKFHKAKKYENSSFLKIDIHKLITKSYHELVELQLQIKSKFPVKYAFTKLTDHLLRKRKI